MPLDLLAKFRFPPVLRLDYSGFSRDGYGSTWKIWGWRFCLPLFCCLQGVVVFTSHGLFYGEQSTMVISIYSI